MSVHCGHNTVASRFTVLAPAPAPGPPAAWTPGLAAWHGASLVDGARNTAYEAAIRRAVAAARSRAAARGAADPADPDALRVVALDAGGSAGLFGVLATRAGADAAVVAEPVAAVAALARDLAAGAGAAGRVTVLHRDAADLTAGGGGGGPLPALGADVVVFDAFDASLLATAAPAAAHRLLLRLAAPGAAIVPRGATLWCAGVCLAAAAPRGSPTPVLAPLDAFWWAPGAPRAVDAARLPLTVLTKPVRAWRGDWAAAAAAGGGPPRVASAPLALEATAAGELNAVLVWFDLDMGDGHVLTTGAGAGGGAGVGSKRRGPRATAPTPPSLHAAPPWAGPGGALDSATPTPPTHWGQGLQALDRWARVARGDRVRLVARPAETGGLRFALRASPPTAAPAGLPSSPSPSRWAPRAPWTEAWGGGDAVENPHVARVRYTDLLLIEAAQRAPCGRWPSVVGDLRPLLDHAGSLSLDPASTAAALRDVALREALARERGGVGVERGARALVRRAA